MACFYQYIELASLLIELGAKIDLQNDDEYTPLDYIMDNEDKEMLEKSALNMQASSNLVNCGLALVKSTSNYFNHSNLLSAWSVGNGGGGTHGHKKPMLVSSTGDRGSGIINDNFDHSLSHRSTGSLSNNNSSQSINILRSTIDVNSNSNLSHVVNVDTGVHLSTSKNNHVTLPPLSTTSTGTSATTPAGDSAVSPMHSSLSPPSPRTTPLDIPLIASPNTTPDHSSHAHHQDQHKSHSQTHHHGQQQSHSHGAGSINLDSSNVRPSHGSKSIRL